MTEEKVFFESLVSMDGIQNDVEEDVSPSEVERFGRCASLTPTRQQIKRTCSLSDIPSDSNWEFQKSRRPALDAQAVEQFLSQFQIKTSEVESQLPVKEGYLWKKSASQVVGWQKRWLQLRDKRLMYYADANAPSPSGVIDFDLVKITLQCLWDPEDYADLPSLQMLARSNTVSGVAQFTAAPSSRFAKIFACCCGARDKSINTTSDVLASEATVSFRLKPMGSKRVFQFSGQLSEVASWIHCLSQHLNAATQVSDPLIVARQLRFWAIDRIPPYKFLEIADTADVLLFKTKRAMSKIQRAFTGAQYDHVALLIRKTDGTLYMLEALGNSGVILTDWKKFVAKGWASHYTRIAVRRVMFTRTPTRMQALLDFCFKYVGKPYGLTFTKLMRSHSLEGEKSDFFCSELVAQAWKAMGILKQDGVSSTQVWPGSFSQDAAPPLPLAEGCRLSNELMIDFLLNSSVSGGGTAAEAP